MKMKGRRGDGMRDRWTNKTDKLTIANVRYRNRLTANEAASDGEVGWDG